jgi:hypothetical protein
MDGSGAFVTRRLWIETQQAIKGGRHLCYWNGDIRGTVILFVSPLTKISSGDDGDNPIQPIQ